jgi:hypothetical protein
MLLWYDTTLQRYVQATTRWRTVRYNLNSWGGANQREAMLLTVVIDR